MMSRKLLLGAINEAVAAKSLKERLRDVTIALMAAFPEGYRFVIVVEDGQDLTFTSGETSREQAIRMLEETLSMMKRHPPERGQPARSRG
jgi:hypothetical protein